MLEMEVDKHIQAQLTVPCNVALLHQRLDSFLGKLEDPPAQVHHSPGETHEDIVGALWGGCTNRYSICKYKLHLCLLMSSS